MGGQKPKECPQCGNTITQPSDHDWTCDFHPDSQAHNNAHGT